MQCLPHVKSEHFSLLRGQPSPPTSLHVWTPLCQHVIRGAGQPASLLKARWATGLRRFRLLLPHPSDTRSTCSGERDGAEPAFDRHPVSR